MLATAYLRTLVAQSKRPKRIPWPALHGQFGAGSTRLRAFRQHVKEPLALALAVYPEAQVEVDDDAGVTLHPSPSPVPKRRLRQG